MWKKIILIIVLVLVVALGGGVAFLSLKKPAQVPPGSIKVAMTPERIARGKTLFVNIAHCDGCHSERDFSRVGGPTVESGRGRGNVLSSFISGLPGTIVAPNLTPDAETGLGNWTDGEKIRAIREGIDRDGRGLFPMMPYSGYRSMSDEDVESLVAYMDSLAPVKNPLPPTQVSFPVNLMIKGVPQPAGSVPPVNPSDQSKYGEYLVTLGGCMECHTPVSRGQSIPGKEFAGGRSFPTIFGTVVSGNITPDTETGIGKWSQEYFLKKFYDYKEYAAGGAPKLSGPEAFTLMPWLEFSQLPAEDLGAIYSFLRTKPAVHNAVETHPGAPPKSAALIR